MRKMTLFSLAITLFAFAVGGVLYRRMPEIMVTHWGLSGTPNGFSPRTVGVFAIPVMLAFMWLVFLVAPMIDPKRKNIEHFRPAFDRFILILFMFMEYLYILTLAWNLGYHFDLLRAVLPAFAVVYYGVGELIEDTEPNWTVGIRLPWTLSSVSVWKQTNKLGGILFKYSAIVAACTLLFPAYGLYLVLAPVLATTIIVAVYAYILFRKETARH